MGERLFFLVSWALWRLLFARRERPAHPRAILVVKLDHLGDGILASPAFEALHRAYPNARIDLLCARWNRAAFQTNPHVNRVLVFNPRTFRRDDRPCDAAARKWRALVALRGQYDLVVTLRGSWLALLLAHGYWLDRGAVRTEMRLRGERLPRHETEITLSILEFGGIPVADRTPEYALRQEDRDAATDLLERLRVPTDRPLIALHVGSPVREKRWVPMRYAQLAERFAEEGAHTILLGAMNEEPLTREVRELANVPMTDLTGRTTFPQTAAVLARCACFVGNDSAPMHLAAAVGIPTVGLFFASDPDRFGPRGKHVRHLRAKDPLNLSVEDVFEAARSLWKPDPPLPPS